MILKKLYIHNYKSFYDTTIELNKFNIIIGENNSGKSNIIDVLEFIDSMDNEDFIRAITQRGGFDKILNYNYNEEMFLLELTLEEDNFLIKVRLTVKKEVNINTLVIYVNQNDTLLPLAVRSIRNNIIIKRTKNKKFLHMENINMLNLFEKFVTLELKYLLLNIPYSLSQTYGFNTETIRNESHKKSIINLQKDGSNLGKNLFEIKKNYPDSFESISNSMIGIINEIDGMDVRETFGNYLIGFYEKNQEIGIDMVSDGTINLLATMTALNQDEDKSILLAFDEPERYLHLKAVHYLLDSFRASEKQILITTHSTEILKDANLDEIIFIYRDSNGDTQSIKASDIPDLEGKMKRLGYERPLSLDELIADGIIGDFG